MAKTEKGMADATIVRFDYINHRGEKSQRTVRPISLWFGSTAWHREAQWHLSAFDMAKQETRDFAMSGIIGNWQSLSQSDTNKEPNT